MLRLYRVFVFIYIYIPQIIPSFLLLLTPNISSFQNLTRATLSLSVYLPFSISSRFVLVKT